MNTPTITFIPAAEHAGIGKLCIPGVCTLESLYRHPNCPPLVKETLEKHVTWQMRCETPVHLALNLKNQYLPFRAAMAVFGVGDIDETEDVRLEITQDPTSSSMVRPTPAHKPTVSAFVRIKLNDSGIVQDCVVALTGAENRRLSLPDTQMLVGKNLSKSVIQEFSNNVSEHYPCFKDIYGSESYRKAMIAVTLERALKEVNHE
ncbi:MAG: hypothetical protein V2J07_08500 [Anaerolineae bacterium]|jgi:hypothetical protein|nr:hypothetical protein [Anaerolineae bacterium]